MIERRSVIVPAVELRGNADLRRALRRFTPDLEKALRKELAAALRPVVKQARGFVTADSPMSGWAMRPTTSAKFPLYDVSTIKAGIGYKTSPGKVNKYGFSSMASISNKSAAGSIYEIAGRVSPQGQPWVGPKAGGASKKVSHSTYRGAGAQFISNLPPIVSSLKGQGRLIFRAWAANRGVAEGAAMKAIDKTVTEFNRRASNGPLSKAS